MTGPAPLPTGAPPGRASARLQAELDAARSELKSCRESHERNLRALCAIADGIAIVDDRGCITCLNPVASHLTGWKESDCLGRRLANVVQFTDHQGRAVDVLSEGFSSDRDAIVSLVRRDGHVILVDGAVSPVHGHDKRTIGAVVTFRNVTASTRLARELAYHANHDALTGLHNRRAFQAQLQRAIGNASEFGTGNALLYLDLDRFKAVNDGSGHAAGDELLRQLALLLRKQLREHDTVARIGGDEFAVLLENCTPAHATRVANKICTALMDFTFAWDGSEYRIGASIGQVDFCDGECSMEELLGLADSLCYVAKEGGRNQVAIHDGEGNHTRHAGHDVSHRPDSRLEIGERA
jgi:diguanylate cyclase (GGDEF)-like protein/PAS domain S-box-containing protein